MLFKTSTAIHYSDSEEAFGFMRCIRWSIFQTQYHQIAGHASSSESLYHLYLVCLILKGKGKLKQRESRHHHQHLPASCTSRPIRSRRRCRYATASLIVPIGLDNHTNLTAGDTPSMTLFLARNAKLVITTKSPVLPSPLSTVGAVMAISFTELCYCGRCNKVTV